MPHPAMSPHHVAVITGGASGIGLAAAMRFAGLGMRVSSESRSWRPPCKSGSAVPTS